MLILGLDIGGANTKAALLEFTEGNITRSASVIEYFPFWEKTNKDIINMLNRLVKNVRSNWPLSKEEIEYIAVSITAELSDAFYTKRQGIFIILEALKEVFGIKRLTFINTHNQFVDYSLAKKDYLAISAANWVGTALFVGNFLHNCILIDGGSTTIDMIPIVNSLPSTIGKNDTSRMLNHELIYTGGLRATIPSITHFVPYHGNNIRISFEKFALVSDVHRILKNISEEEYINDTADNRSTSLEDCYARLARTICSDLDLVSKKELNIIAGYIYEKQIGIITSEIKLLMRNLFERHPEFKNNPQFIITGLCADFLIKKALINLNYTNILDFKQVTNISDNISSSAFALAGALYYNHLKKK
ncbi:MAG: hydantoinase/oxoprolinase family protein [Candidatus Lokiarchaeota archaeon]|jgi:probable H4MPT-linked C1 transfer pathway protein